MTDDRVRIFVDDEYDRLARSAAAFRGKVVRETEGELWSALARLSVAHQLVWRQVTEDTIERVLHEVSVQQDQLPPLGALAPDEYRAEAAEMLDRWRKQTG